MTMKWAEWAVGNDGDSVVSTKPFPGCREECDDIWLYYGGYLVAESVPKRYASLIAAAPDLYAACAEFVRKCDCGEARSTHSYAQMKAALARARGGERRGRNEGVKSSNEG